MMPPMNSTGMKTAASESVIERTVKPISRDPSNAACIRGSGHRVPGGNARPLERVSFHMLLWGFLGAHLSYVVFFERDGLTLHPGRILNPLGGIYSFGGLLSRNLGRNLLWLLLRLYEDASITVSRCSLGLCFRSSGWWALADRIFGLSFAAIGAFALLFAWRHKIIV